MNSVSALFGRFNELSSQLTTEQPSHPANMLGHGQSHQNEGHGSSQMSRYEVSLSFSSASYTSHENGVRILEQELEVRFTGARSSQDAAPSTFMPTFQPPSVEDVANKVLGFVENRIKQESDNGASTERLENLLDQAREGVEKGFGQAREQIESYGLMTDQLDDEIGQSFEKINTGLDGLEDQYVDGRTVEAEAQTNPVESDDDDVDDEERSDQVVASNVNQPNSANDQSGDNQSASANDEGVANSPAGINAGYSSLNATAERAAIQITTQDGDVVSFNLEQIQASFEKGAMSAGRYGFESSQYAGQYQSGEYSYSVDGDLDEGEIQALNDLMVQIEGMSEQFFSGDFQGAFQSALELGFDGEEIAGFSVNLSQASVQQVNAYQQVADLGEGDDVPDVGSDFGHRFDPLKEFFESLQAAFDKASQFSQPAQLVSDLFGRVTEDRVGLESEKVETSKSFPFEQFESYMSALLERL